MFIRQKPFIEKRDFNIVSRMIIPTKENIKTSNGNKIYQYVAALIANLGTICCEMHYAWPSPSIPILESGNYTFTISSTESSWLVVITLFGAIIGSLTTGQIVDIFGRKKLIVFSSIPWTISWLLIAWAKSSTLMFIGRFIAGLTEGLSFTILPMYLGEIAEPRIRGLIASVLPVCIILGFLLISVLGSFLSITTTAYVSTVPPILLLVSFIWMPETPYFYLMKGKIEDARRSLQIFRGMEDVTSELQRMDDAVREDNQKKGKCSDLLTNHVNRKNLLTALGLRGLQQFSGAAAITFYCQKIFQESSNLISPSFAVIIYFGVQLVMSVLTSIIVDYFGRRPLLIISAIGVIMTLFFQGTYLYIKDQTSINTTSFDYLPLVTLLLFVVTFGLGLQVIPLVIIGEIFPTNVKGIAMCLVHVYNSIIVIIISQLFHWTNEFFGMYVPFFAFSVSCTLGLIFVILVVPETKGKSLEKIQQELRDRNKS